MSLYSQTITYLLAIVETGESKSCLGEKLHDWFGGKDFDLGSAFEWIKNQRTIDDVTKSVLGLSLSFLKPKDDEKKRRFILEPLAAVGTSDTKRKGIELYNRKLPKLTSFHGAFELAEGYNEASILYALREMYLNPRSLTMQVKLGALCAFCEKEASQNHRAVNRAQRSRVLGVREEHRRVDAERTARAMKGMGESEDVRRLADELSNSIGVLRQLGGESRGSGIDGDALKIIKASSMGKSALLMKHMPS